MTSSKNPLAHPSVTLIAVSLAVAVIVFLGAHNRSLSSRVSALSAEIAFLKESTATVEKKMRTTSKRLQRAERERRRLILALNGIQKEHDEVQFELKKAESVADTANEEKVYLEEMLLNKTKEIEKLRTGAPSSATAPVDLSAAPADLAAQIRARDAEIAKLNEQNTALSAKLERLYKTTSDRIAEINIAKITLEETVAEARKSIEQEFAAVDLGSIRTPGGQGAPAQRSAPKQEGRVLAVNAEHGFVVVDLGRVDALKTETALEVSRGGKRIARLSVLEVRDVMAACNVAELYDGTTVGINDVVSVVRR
ncbi:MAG: hypothetical protein MOGMAGMI_02197 [Candidatus Omnitrophica bacterium]|nr:hypothetical protein [Candidatus Omnitrophota bacterium]